VYSFDEEGKMELINKGKGGLNPSWMVKHPKMEVVYAVNEVCDHNAERSGSVTAMSLDRDTGSLTMLNRVDSGGGQPVFASIDSFGKYLVVATYSGGNVTVLPINRVDGSLGEPLASYAQGFGSHSAYIRKSGPAHQADKIHVIAPVLGEDKVDQYQMSAQTGELTPAKPLILPKGSGPRHLAFDDLRHFAYIADEGGADTPSRMTQCYLGTDNGYLPSDGAQCTTHSTIPDGMNSTDMYPAEIYTARDGLFVLISNRDATDAGRDSIAVFAADGLDLKPVGYFKVGHYPRSFTLNKAESVLFVGNQKSQSVTSMKFDKSSGKLTDTGVKTMFKDQAGFVGIL
jgi:6-phosphogluconolactonase